MAVTRLTTNGLTGTKYDIASADNYYMEPIATTLVGAGGVSSIAFTNIPQGYKHLQLRWIARSTNTSFQQIAGYGRFNSDSGSNYAWHQFFGDGGSAGASSGTTQTNMLLLQEGSTVNNPGNTSFGAGVLDILDYANTSKFKTVKSLTGSDINGAGTIALRSGLWQSTSAITGISFTESSNFAQHSRFSLYGIKG